MWTCAATTLDHSPFQHFWLDGESIALRQEQELAN